MDISKYIKLNEDLFFHFENATIVDREMNEVRLNNLESLVLQELVRKRGEIVSKDELLALWPTNLVQEHCLSRVISMLRKKLNDNSNSPKFIKTCPRVGYKFIDNSNSILNNQKSQNKSEFFQKVIQIFESHLKVFLFGGMLLILLFIT